MPIADSDGTSIYYERHGSGPAILFVHGSGGHHAAWWQQVAALRDEFTVVTIDLRGFGKSDSSMTEFDGQDFPGDVVAVLDQEDLTDAMLVGQSIGSVAALRAASCAPSASPRSSSATPWAASATRNSRNWRRPTAPKPSNSRSSTAC